MTYALIRNVVNFYLPFVDDSIDVVEVEFMRWRSHWLRHEGDSLPYNTGRVAVCKRNGSSSLNIDNWSGYYSNK